jgi:hypothetical protein
MLLVKNPSALLRITKTATNIGADTVVELQKKLCYLHTYSDDGRGLTCIVELYVDIPANDNICRLVWKRTGRKNIEGECESVNPPVIFQEGALVIHTDGSVVVHT